jgi:hypothetical protein
MGIRYTRRIPTKSVSCVAFSLIPAKESGRPIVLEAVKTMLPEVFYEILGRQSEHGSNGGKVSRSGMCEVSVKDGHKGQDSNDSRDVKHIQPVVQRSQEIENVGRAIIEFDPIASLEELLVLRLWDREQVAENFGMTR